MFGLLIFALVGCQSGQPGVPTAIPVGTSTRQPATPSPLPTASPGPSPTIPDLIAATAIPPTAGPVAEVPTAIPPKEPFCLVAKSGDTLFGILYQGGYGQSSLALEDEFRRINNMPPGSKTIVLGQKYCVPAPTPTPTPPGYDKTKEKIMTEVPVAQARIEANATYVVVEGDNLISVQLKTGVSLRVLCDLNNPSPLNCGGCAIDRPIGQQGCRPSLRIGDVLRIPGPTPTPTITPTLSGSETVTPTPIYGGPKLASPYNGGTVSGSLRLLWMPVGILKPDEYYLVLLRDMTNGQQWVFDTRATSLQLPDTIRPANGHVQLAVNVTRCDRTIRLSVCTERGLGGEVCPPFYCSR
jgi:hypothetical protein